jgi:hypothetical protein
MVNGMRTSATIDRPIPVWVVGLARRTLLVTGLLLGFFLLGSALAHADPKQPHPAPGHGIGHGLLSHLPLVSDTITSVTSDPIKSVTKVVTDVTKTVTPVTKAVTTLTTDVTSEVVRTTMPILQPAVGMTGPILQPVITPVLDPGTSPTRAETPAAAPDVDPIAVVPVAPSMSAPFFAAPPSISVVPPLVLPAPAVATSSDTMLLPGSGPLLPPGGEGPIVDVTGAGSCGGASGPSGPVAGMSRPFFGLFAAALTGVRVRAGTGPPKWCLFDPRHHPS